FCHQLRAQRRQRPPALHCRWTRGEIRCGLAIIRLDPLAAGDLLAHRLAFALAAYLCSRVVSSSRGKVVDVVCRSVVVCARMPMLISVRDSGLATGVGDMMVMGLPLGGVAVRPLGLWRPSTR